MDEAVFQAICKEKYDAIEIQNSMQDKRLDNHGDRLDRLENDAVRTETIVKNLCDQLKSLTTALWWFVGVTVTACIGFVIWYIQNIPR